MRDRLERIGLWWHKLYDDDRPLIKLQFDMEEKNELQSLWKSPGISIDTEKLVKRQIKNLFSSVYFGESYPVADHLWGGRGVPMAMAAYLGGKVHFRETTVWVEPVVDDWEDFEIQFDENNFWVQRSKELMECQLDQTRGDIMVSLPDFGDALTVFSLLRGSEKLLVDLIESPDMLKEKINDFIRAWKKAHKYFHSIYKKVLPGDCSWLLWAPGKTYACQCDLSTMISPRMFEEFVVPEIESLGEYLDYIIWHLDGPDEIKHLDILLNLPEVKAIQISAGAGKPPCASDMWIPIMKKIQSKNKLVYAEAENKEEFKKLVSSLNSKQLFVWFS